MTDSSSIAMEVPSQTIGLDLGDRYAHFCVLAADGRRAREGRVAMTREVLEAFFEEHSASRVVVEVGTHSGWVSRLGKEAGHEVIVANARRVKLISENNHKTDRSDAELLAQMGRLDPQLLSPIQHRSVQNQAHLAVLRARATLVKTRVALINHVRGAVKSYGQRIQPCSAESFHKRVRTQIPAELKPALERTVDVIETTTAQIRAFDKQIEGLADVHYGVTRLLREVPGVGALVATHYVLTIGDRDRLRHSRQAGPYFGITPRSRQSGDKDPQLRITKAGDGEMRRLLVISANYILGPFGPECDLKRFGLKIAERGGKNARKRAKVAVARKLAVLLHRLWTTGETYDPFYLAKRRGEPVPA